MVYMQLCESAQKLRDVYAITPDQSLFKREFGFYSMERWKEQRMLQDVPPHQLFDYDPSGNYGFGQLGWCEAAFLPVFETKIIEDRGEHELVQYHAGRHVLFLRGVVAVSCQNMLTIR